jgi:hypothetical protein
MFSLLIIFQQPTDRRVQVSRETPDYTDLSNHPANPGFNLRHILLKARRRSRFRYRFGVGI